MNESLPVSAVISCYNHRQFVLHAVRTVLEQDPPIREVCVVDDGSTDGSYDLLRSVGQDIRLVSHPGRRNEGHPATVNLGIRETSQPYVAFLDSDDFWYQAKAGRQVEALERDPDLGAVYTNGDAVDAEANVLYPLFPPGFEERNEPERLLLDNYISAGMSAVMVRRRWLDEVGLFDPALRWTKDHDMWLRLIERATLAYLPERLMAYRRHNANMSLGRGQWDDGFMVLRAAAGRYPYSSASRRKRLAVLHYRIGSYEWRRGARLAGIFRLALAGALDPPRALSLVVGQVRGRSQAVST